jgi:hypothetical protein
MATDFASPRSGVRRIGGDHVGDRAAWRFTTGEREKAGRHRPAACQPPCCPTPAASAGELPGSGPGSPLDAGCNPAVGNAVQRFPDASAADAGQPPLPHAHHLEPHRGSSSSAVRPRAAGSRPDYADGRRQCRTTWRCWSWQGRCSKTRRVRRRSGGPGLSGCGGAPALSRCTAAATSARLVPCCRIASSSLFRGRDRPA